MAAHFICSASYALEEHDLSIQPLTVIYLFAKAAKNTWNAVMSFQYLLRDSF